MEARLGSIENPIKFRDQDFQALLEKCLKSGQLFADPTFLPEQKSIGMPEDPNPKKAIKWQRPKEISKNAVFVEDTIGTTDICQGQLGNCWLLAALSCLTMHPQLFVKVVPANQSLSEPYAGIFHFMFWQYGEWVEVVVDDRLPVCEGRLLFSYSRTRNEYWSALVEKAYAKLIGCYGSLKGGNISEGMEDFTGGIARSLKVTSRTPRVLWRSLTAALSRGSLLSCFIKACSTLEIGKVTEKGLIKGHAYAITNTDKVMKVSDEVLLLKLRNPWGFVEYRGPWSDKGKEWDDVVKAEKERIQLQQNEDGEFWYVDFCSLFDVVELCSVNPDNLEEENPPASTWTISEHRGFWLQGSSAGGSRKYNRSFWRNPQFQLVLTEGDYSGQVYEGGSNEDKKKAEKQKQKGRQCTVLVELLQKNRRKDTVNFLQIAFHIYEVTSTLFLTFGFIKYFDSLTLCHRGVWKKLLLEPGNYIIVASTYRPNQPGEFFVRIFSKTGNTLGTQDFTCSSGFLQLMATPASPEDQVRVQKTFDEEASQDDRLNAKKIMKLFNTALDKNYHLPLETCRQLIFGQAVSFWSLVYSII
uniref:Calpain 12 n=1 Tax=Sander lucioperca TaxID=283035 RepID=A0A8C9YFI0_SANLU